MMMPPPVGKILDSIPQTIALGTVLLLVIVVIILLAS
jgi:hypothetical protein